MPDFLDASLLARTAAIVRDRRAVFDGFNVQTGGLQGSNGALATTSWALDANFDFFNAKLHGFFGGCLGGTLAREGSAFPAAFESTSTGTGPAKRFAFGVSDSYGRVVEGRLNVSNAVGHISTDATFLCFSHF